MLDKASAPTENCVYIDDKIDFLAPANELGMKTIHFINPKELFKDLRNLGVIIDKEFKDDI